MNEAIVVLGIFSPCPSFTSLRKWPHLSAIRASTMSGAKCNLALYSFCNQVYSDSFNREQV